MTKIVAMKFGKSLTIHYWTLQLCLPWPTLTQATCTLSYVTDTCNIPIFSCTRISASRVHLVTWRRAASAISDDESITSSSSRRRGSRCSSCTLPISVLNSNWTMTTWPTSGLLFAGSNGGCRWSTNDRPYSVNVNTSSSMASGNDDFVDVNKAWHDGIPRNQKTDHAP